MDFARDLNRRLFSIGTYFWIAAYFPVNTVQPQRAGTGSPCGHSPFDDVHLLWTLLLWPGYNVGSTKGVHY